MRYHSDTGFIDMLFNLLVGLFFMFVISFLLINPIKKDAETKKPKAEFLITSTWDYGNPDDIDIWIQDPLENILYFSRKETGMMHLDRDDRGNIKDKLTLSDGTIIENKTNQEIVSIRGFIYGEWMINLHAYYKRKKDGPANVTIKIDKLNPKVETLFLKTFKLTETWEEITVTRFTMGPKGATSDWHDFFSSLVQTEYPNGPSYPVIIHERQN